MRGIDQQNEYIRGRGTKQKRLTQRLDIILIEAPFDVLDHQARLSDLRVPDHAHLDDDAAGSESLVITGEMGCIPVLFIIVGEQRMRAVG
jgi:hypothetical protein